MELLRAGKIVIVDLSEGDPAIQRTYSERICQRIFKDFLHRFIGNPKNRHGHKSERGEVIGYLNFIQMYFEEAEPVSQEGGQGPQPDIQPPGKGRGKVESVSTTRPRRYRPSPPTSSRIPRTGSYPTSTIGTSCGRSSSSTTSRTSRTA